MSDPDGEPAEAAPLDPTDPRYVGDRPAPRREHPRRLVRSEGPGSAPENPRVRILRAAIPLLFAAGIVVVAAMFFRSLSPGTGVEVVGEEAAVRDAVRERPRRVCWKDRQPCAWLTVVDDRLLALSTSGPLREEFGRQGIRWCPSSGFFGSNTSGSRFDAAGQHVSGPAIRGLDRYLVWVGDDGLVRVNFFSLTAGRRTGRPVDLVPPTGPDCDELPFDRQPDLRLDQRSSTGSPTWTTPGAATSA